MLQTTSAPSFKIADVCRVLGATPRALRFYEHRGLVSVARCGGVRVYSAENVERLRLIVAARRANLSLSQAGMALNAGGSDARRSAFVDLIGRRAEVIERERQSLALLGQLLGGRPAATSAAA